MIVMVGVLFGFALCAAALARWTRAHPLLIALAFSLIGAAMATLVGAGFMSPASLVAGTVGGLLVASSAALGGFLGWLRRTYVEKTE